MLSPYLVIKIFILHLNDLSCTHFYFFFWHISTLYEHYPSGLHCMSGRFYHSWVFLQYTEIAVTSAVTYNIIKFLVEKQKNFLLYPFSGVKRHTPLQTENESNFYFIDRSPKWIQKNASFVCYIFFSLKGFWLSQVD